MKNLLRLHEAIAVVLLSRPDRTATFQTIARAIERRNLFPERKGNITLEKQIELRIAISSSKYKHLFEVVSSDKIKLI